MSNLLLIEIVIIIKTDISIKIIDLSKQLNIFSYIVTLFYIKSTYDNNTIFYD